MILTLVNDLLDLAKIDQFKFKLHEDYFDLSQMVRHSCQTMQPLAQMKGVKLKALFKVKSKKADSSDDLLMIPT